MGTYNNPDINYNLFPAHWQVDAIRQTIEGIDRLVPGNLPKMDPEIKAEWVAALRSGTYKQGKGKLKAVFDRWSAPETLEGEQTELRHCCLGVLSELAIGKEGGLDGCRFRGETSNDKTYSFFRKFRNEDGTIAEDAIDWGSWDVMPGETIQHWSKLSPEIDTYLATFNDQGATFAQIADFIEAEL